MRVSLNNLYQSAQRCQRGKGKSAQAQRYRANLLENIIDTQSVLQSYQYRPQTMHTFIASNGSKPREIHAPAFSDRVVHHYLVPKLEAFINPKFIFDSAANQKNKGTHFAVRRLQKMMRQLDASLEQRAQSHYLQLDIHNFFYSIDKRLLLDILAKHLKLAIKKHQINKAQARDYYRLCQQILKHTAPSNRISGEQMSKIPPHKQLQNIAEGKGLPIGNLSSQFFSNVYMNELDQFIKHTLKAKHYVRFVDDFVLLHADKSQLSAWQAEIELFLAQQLALKLKPAIILRPISQGVDFLGYIIYPHYQLNRKRVLGNFYAKLKAWQHTYSHQAGKGTLFKLNQEAREQLTSMIASYLGHFSHAKSEKALQEKQRQFPWISLFFMTTPSFPRTTPRMEEVERRRSQSRGGNPATPEQPGKPSAARIEKSQWQTKLNNKYASKLTHQIEFFKQHFTSFTLILQKGNHFIIDNLAQEIHQKHQENQKQAYQAKGTDYIEVSEQGYTHNRLKNRYITELFISHNQQQEPYHAQR